MYELDAVVNDDKSAFLELNMSIIFSLFKSKTDDYNMQDLKGFINLTIHKYFVHT